MATGLTLALGLAAFFAVRRPDGSSGVRRQHALWLIVAVGSAFFMLPASDRVWRALPFLQAVQFPFRWGSVFAAAAAAAAAVAALVALGASTREHRSARGPTVAAAAVLLSLCVVTSARAAFRAAFPPPMTAEGGEYVRSRLTVFRGASEYLPRWSRPLDIQAVQELLGRLSGPDGKLIPVRSSGQEARPLVRRWSPGHIELAWVRSGLRS